MQCIVIFITTADKKESERLSSALLKKRLIACANLVNNIESCFWWKRKRQKAKECLIIAKSRKMLLNKIIKTVRSMHSYECPEIIAIPISGGYRPYMEWIRKETM